MPPADGTALIQALEDTFVQAGAQGFLHAIALDGDQEVAYHADAPVVLASVFKIPVLLELARQAAAGRLDLSERVRVGTDARTEGPTGISVMLDEIELSLRDLAFLMMSVSDNAATDVLVRRLGVDAINGMLRALGCGRTVIEGDCQYLIDTVHEDLGIPATADLDAMPGGLDPARIAACRALRPEVTNRSTPSDMTRLLALVWRDEAGPASACAEVRRILALQVWPHRLTSGFPDDEVTTSCKTGTLPMARNEVGVVEYPDGGRYAVAVFTRTPSAAFQQPWLDAAIGKAARLAVTFLRESR